MVVNRVKVTFQNEPGEVSDHFTSGGGGNGENLELGGRSVYFSFRALIMNFCCVTDLNLHLSLPYLLV